MPDHSSPALDPPHGLALRHPGETAAARDRDRARLVTMAICYTRQMLPYLQTIAPYLQAAVLFLTSVWAALTAYDHRENREKGLFFAALALALVAFCVVRVLQISD